MIEVYYIDILDYDSVEDYYLDYYHCMDGSEKVWEYYYSKTLNSGCHEDIVSLAVL